MKKPAIPDTPKPAATPAERFLFDDAVRRNIDMMAGRLGGRVKPLPADATLDDAIAKINEILARLM